VLQQIIIASSESMAISAWSSISLKAM